MVRTSQGGSILSFIIVAVVLAGLLVGGAYVIHRQASPSSESQPAPAPVAVPSEPDPSSSSDTSSDASTKPVEQSNEPNSDTSQQPASPSEPSDDETAMSDQSGSDTSASLPHTGPRASVISAVVVAVITYATVAYGQSRRSIYN